MTIGKENIGELEKSTIDKLLLSPCLFHNWLTCWQIHFVFLNLVQLLGQGTISKSNNTNPEAVSSNIMTTTSTDKNLIEFYKFLNGDTTLLEIEIFVYKQPDLEQQVKKNIYLELISFDFKDKNANADLRQFIFKHVVAEGQFEMWKLKSLLNNFLTDFSNIHKYLDQLYHLYCGIYQENGQQKYQYKFLSNLGLNYLYWVDEGYMKVNYGANWEKEYKNCQDDFEFYHSQLKPFAIEVLDGLKDNRIQIFNDGTYKITEDLKAKLETDTIFQLKHPDKKYGRKA